MKAMKHVRKRRVPSDAWLTAKSNGNNGMLVM